MQSHTHDTHARNSHLDSRNVAVIFLLSDMHIWYRFHLVSDSGIDLNTALIRFLWLICGASF